RILVTALGKKKNIQTLSHSGFAAHLFKPVYPEMLISCVSNILDGKEAPNFVGGEFAPMATESLPHFGAHVLIVEDDRISQRMAKSALKELGCTFDVAGDGREAL